MINLKIDTKKLTRNLNGLQFSAIPEAQKKSLYKFGFLNKKKLRQEMLTGQGKFINPVPLTLASPLYKVEDQSSMVFFIRSNIAKGNKPSKYLAPVEYTTGSINNAYETKFSYWLRNYSGLSSLSNKYAIPVMKSSAVQKNKYGNMKPSQYAAVKSGLERFASGAKKAKGNQYSYFSIPSKGGKKASRIRPMGIYRAKGNTLGLLFTLSNKKPKVKQKFKFVGLTKKFLDKDMPYIFKSELRKQLAQFK
jgi:hypothetical protein|tara:strand:- start:13 stop:759 length:747 start_codon:yes stop_codon:yes gene_type:complete